MRVTIQIVVDETTYNMGQGIRRFVSEARKALADGFQPGQDVPVLAQAVLADLFPLMSEFEKMRDTIKADPTAFRKALVECAEDIVGDFLE